MNSLSSRWVSWGMTAFLLAVLTGVSVSRAADRWWDGGTVDIAGNGDGASGGTTGIWNTATLNWDQGNGLAHVAWVNTNNDTAIFAGTAGTVTLGVPVTANALTFNTANYTISSGTLTLAGATPTLTVNANATINSILAGSAGLTKAGAGTLTLGGANTFTGGLTVNGGKWVGTVAGSVGAGTITVNAGSTLSWTVGGYSDFAYLSGGNTVNIFGGTVSMDATSGNAHNLKMVPVIMQGGTLTSINGPGGAANDGGFGNIGFNGFNFGGGGSPTSLTVSGPGQSTISATTVGFVNGAVINVGVTGAAVDLLVTSVINGGAIIKTGLGTMALTGANTYTGTTTINAGTLSLVGGAAIPNTLVTLSNTVGATLNLASSEAIGSLAGGGANGGNVTLNANTLTLGGDNSSQSFAGVISGSGGVTKVGTGTQTLTGTNTYGGLTTVSGGALVLANALAVRNSVISNNTVNGLQFSGGTAFTVVGLAGGTNLSLVNTVGAPVTLSVGNNDTTASFSGGLTGSGTLRKIGAGTQTLGGAGTFSGGMEVDEGTLVLAANNVGVTNTAVILNGGVLDAGVQTNAWGGLILGGDSVLRLTTGCSLSFADSTSLVWSNAMLTVVGDFPEKAVRFGTSAAGLTRAQLLKIRYHDQGATLDGEGFLVLLKSGTCIIIE